MKHFFEQFNFDNKKHLLSVIGTVFIFVAIPVTVFLAQNARQLTTPAATIPGQSGPKSPRFVPIIFYAKDSNPPTTAELVSIEHSLDKIKVYYQNQLGGTFDYLPARVVQGAYSKYFYGNTDFFSCGSKRISCNIASELIFLEKNTLSFFGVRNTGIGWEDRNPLIFTKDILQEDNLVGWTQQSLNPDYPNFSVLNDRAIQVIANDSGQCSDARPADYGMGGHDACSVIAHEIGHALGLPHFCLPGNIGLMCTNSGPTRHFPDQNVQLLPSPEALLATKSPFFNPKDMLSPRFCFGAENANDWCIGSDIFRNWRASSVLPGHDLTPASLNQPKPDCCRVTVNNQLITLGGFTIEVCGHGINRSDANQRTFGCQIKYQDLVQTYSKTLQIKPLDASANAARYDIYIDYKTITAPINNGQVPFKDGRIPWKVISDQTALCFNTTCPLTVSWSVPKYKAYLYKAGTTTSACSGYSQCVDSVTVNENSSNLKPSFTGLPPKLPVDMIVKLQAFENSGITYKHFSDLNFNTPTCPNIPTASLAPIAGSQSLTGAASSQSITLNWSAPSSWGNECNFTYPREYLVSLSPDNPPLFYTKTAGLNITISNLKSGTTYYWRIAAENTANVSSAYSTMGSFTTAPALPTNAFAGKYFDNNDFTNLKVERTDPKIYFSWGTGSPDSVMGPDEFSVEWKGTFNFDGSLFRFNAQGDDSFLIYIDNNLVMKSPIANNLVTPTAGVHEVKVVYVEGGGNASMKFNFVKARSCFDFDADGAVSILDMSLVSNHFGETNPLYDLDGDGKVSILDLTLISNQVGQRCG